MEFETLTPNLMVEDVNATVTYYEQYLQARLISHVPGPEPAVWQWAMVQTGGLEIMFQSIASLGEDVPALKASQPGGSFTLFVRMTGVEELYRHMQEGAEIAVPMKDTFYGMREFTIKDLNGYLLTFAERLPGDPDADQSV